MNIFILDNNMEDNVAQYVDKHVVKMILEHAQMLSTVVVNSGGEARYKPTHVGHPCTKWAAESLSNWLYLRDLTECLHKEWQYRYGHTHNHKSWDAILELDEPNIEDKGLTPFAQAMPYEFKCNDAVTAYREYYKHNKQHIFGWTRRPVPEWIGAVA